MIRSFDLADFVKLLAEDMIQCIAYMGPMSSVRGSSFIHKRVLAHIWIFANNSKVPSVERQARYTTTTYLSTFAGLVRCHT